VTSHYDSFSKSLSAGNLKSFPADLLSKGKAIVSDLLGQDARLRKFLSEKDRRLLERISVLSPFVRNIMQRRPNLLCNLLERDLLVKSLPQKDLWKIASDFLNDAKNEADYCTKIRNFRNEMMLRIAIRDLGGICGFKETVADLSYLACICLEKTISWLEQDMDAKFGQPCDETGRRVRLIVLGMGKLGAFELNFSSDIDLVFSYSRHGKTKGGKHSITNDEYFLEQCRRLVRIFSMVTPDGFVFRVDTRLRPFGDSGPLVICSEAMVEYYENHGRQWERYALLKASAVAGDIEEGNTLLESLKPFIYRRYIDYSTVDSLKEMKAMILAEQAGRTGTYNVKLGPGGIRDIEFVVQTFQLIKGGRIKALQVRPLLDALDVIKRLKLLDENTCTSLGKAYVFLRTVEHRLQEYDDRQVQTLPEDKRRRQLLSLSLGFDSWAKFHKVYSEHTNKSAKVFRGLFEEKREAGQTSETCRPHKTVEAMMIWSDPLDDKARRGLSSLGFSAPDKMGKLLSSFKESKKVKALSGQVREIIDTLVPSLIEVSTTTPNPDKALEAGLNIFEAVLKRSIYLVLLNQHPSALRHLVYLCSRSRMVAELLRRQPILLDELVSGATLFRSYSKNNLKELLDTSLSAISPNDLEHWLDEIRRFKKAHILRIAATQLRGMIDAFRVGIELSNLAEVCLDAVFNRAWKDLSEKGPDFVRKCRNFASGGLAVVAYGKLGSKEMNYSSDLDLVFLYDHKKFGNLTVGEQANLGYFYSRLIQRAIFLVSARTSQGILYEIDTRLRPNGSQGILVSTLSTFEHYQHEKAWTWEHQALIKARFLAGDNVCGMAFEKIREKVLGKKRQLVHLKTDIIEMRNKITKALSPKLKEKGLFHIKKSPGGLTDIEFIVQYLVLAHAYREAALLQFRDNRTLIKVLEDLGLLTRIQAKKLSEPLRFYQEQISLKALDLEEAVVASADIYHVRQGVLETWDQVFS